MALVIRKSAEEHPLVAKPFAVLKFGHRIAGCRERLASRNAIACQRNPRFCRVPTGSVDVDTVPKGREFLADFRELGSASSDTF